MGLARVSGHPDYSASGASKFIPEIWSGKLLVKFYDATVLPQISNTDYEGEIKNQGDKVYIRTRGSVTIKKYYKGMKIDYERIESPAIEMVIDQGNYWYYGIDDVDKYQSDIELMDQWAEDATEQEKIVIDTEVLAAVKAQVAAANKGATAGRICATYNMGVAGTPVEAGQVIGTVGNSGVAASRRGHGEHLHFEINEWDGNRTRSLSNSELRAMVAAAVP